MFPVTEPKVAEIVAEPRATPAANPPAVIDTTPTSDEAQVTELVISCTL